MEDRRKRLINKGGEKEVMKKKSNENGITLIALIITIIILVILAAVSIRAVYDMGIVNHAVNGTQKYAEEAVKENQMLEDTTSLIGDTVKKLNAIQGKVPDALRKYVLGENGTGRSGTEIINMSTMKCIPEEETIPDADETVLVLNLLGGNYLEDSIIPLYGYIRYDNVAYRITCDQNTSTNAITTKAIEAVYVPTGMEGQVVGFKVDQDEDTVSNWLVLYDNGDTVDIMSIDTMDEYQFNADVTEVEDAISEYNNAVSRLNTHCASLINNSAAQRVRSVGTKFDLTDTTKKYSSTFLENNPYTTDKGKYNNYGKDGDMNAEQDVVRMSYYAPGATYTTFGYAYTADEYWLASRFVDESSGIVGFGVRYVYSGNASRSYGLWYVNSAYAYYGNPSCAVRPVVRVAKTALLAPSSN